MNPLFLLAFLHAADAFELPSPYFAEPPFSFGHYCNDTDPYWWQGFVFVDDWGTLAVDENCTVRVNQFDAIEIRDHAHLIAQPDSRLILDNFNQLRLYSDLILKNMSSLILSDRCFLDSKSGLYLGQGAVMEMVGFASAQLDGGLKLSDRSKLQIIDFSRLHVGKGGNLSLGGGSGLKIEAFSSLIIGANAGLKIDSDAGLILKNHSVLEIGKNTWLKLTTKAIVPEQKRLLISDQNAANQLPGLVYLTENDFGM